MAAKFDPKEFEKFKAHAQIDDSKGFDPKEFESFKGAMPQDEQPQSSSMMDVAKQAGTQALNLFGAAPRQQLFAAPAEPLQPTSGNPVMGALQAAGQTLQNPVRISPTLSQPGQIAGQKAEDAIGPNHPILGKVANVATSMALDPQSYATMGENGFNLKMGGTKPMPGGPENVLFTPAELSGKTGASTLETLLEKSPTGGPVIDRFRAVRAKNLSDFIDTVQERLGTTKSSNVAGDEIKAALVKEQTANKATASDLYNQVPQDVKVPVKEFTATYNDLMSELPDSIKNIVKKHVPTEPVNPTPSSAGEFKGVTDSIQTPPSSRIAPTGGFQELGVVKTPGKVEPNYGVKYSASPEMTPPSVGTPTVRDISLLRTKLGAIQRNGGLDAFYAAKLRNALNADVQGLGTSGSALDQMVGKDTADSLRKATDYYREMKTLEDAPLVKRLQTAKVSDLPELIFKGGRKEDVLTAKAALGDGFVVAQRSFFNDLVKAKDVGKTLAKYEPDFLEHALSPDQRQALKLVDSLKQKAGSAERVAPMNGSSRMNALLALWHGLSTNPMGTVATGLIAPYVGAKTYINGVNTMLNPARTGAVAKVSLGSIRDFLNRRGR
jgi:hypothetical protein